jgi:hypothetical protein
MSGLLLMDSRISCYGPVIVQFMASLTRIAAHIYTTASVFPWIVHIC